MSLQYQLWKESFTNSNTGNDAGGTDVGGTDGETATETEGETATETEGETAGETTGETVSETEGETAGETTEETKEDEIEKQTEEQILPIAVRIFNESHVIHLLWFIVIYLIVYVFFGEYLKRSGDTSSGSTMSRIFDYVVFFCAIGFTLFLYYTSSEEVKQNLFQELMDWTIEFYDSPISIFSVSLFMICFYAVVMLLGVPMSAGSKPYSVDLIESKGWILIASLLICYFFKYVLDINLMDLLRSDRVSQLWKTTLEDSPVSEDTDTDTDTTKAKSKSKSKKTTTDTNTETTPKKNEVFNVSNNNLTYREAQAVCKSYNARLATYDEVEDAYTQGAEWCNYGWSDKQMAFFPTQKKTWEELQKRPSMKNRCGRPGINGGHIPNPHMKFGANCYGVKPGATAEELQHQKETKFETNAPKTAEELILEEKTNYWKENRDKLTLNSFNQKQWSRY